MASPAVVAAAVGVVAALLYRAVSGSDSGPFVMQGKTRFWAPREAGKLRALLAASNLTPHSQVERVWVVSPATGGRGNALAHVTAIRARGNVAATTPNLLDPRADRAVGEITPAELGGDRLTPGFAVLPNL